MMRHLLTTSLMLTVAAASGCVALPGLPPSLERPQGAFQPGQVMVAWTAETPPADREAVKTRLGLTALPGRGDRFELLGVPDGAELDTCRRLRGERGVAVAEPNYVVRSRHVPGSLKPAGDRRVQYVPNDLAYGARWEQLKQDTCWGLKAIKADQAWDTTQGDSGITVAVIDTGVDMTHPDLAGNLDTANALNVLEAGRPVDDDFGHGTHVAGIIAAVGDNRQGALGVAFKTRVMPIRVLGVDGSGTLADLVYAIDHAVAKGAHVINMSLGSPDRSELEGEAIKDALAKGVVVVAAAGNEATTGNYAEYPASYPGVLSVGAVGPDLKRAPFSNFNSSVTVVAPGVDIFSTLPVRFGKDNPYGYLSGTSMAAPMVAGAAALVLAAHPTWTPEQVASRLRKTAQNLAVNDETLDYSPFFGDGLIDAAAAVR
jgi:subtilisin family serine protease